MESREKVRRFSNKELIEGSFFEGSQEEWEHQRRWIADAIDRDGTILDIGCANGYLLKSLEQWSDHELEPFGVDVDDRSIKAFKELFPDKEANFALLSDESAKDDFPSEFDLVYWNVWDDSDFDQENAKNILKKAQELTSAGGRIILGFYHPDRAENERKIQQLEKMGIKFERVDTPEDLSDRGIVIDS